MSGRPLSYWSAADLLDPEPPVPVELLAPYRRSTVRGKPIPRRADDAWRTPLFLAPPDMPHNTPEDDQ